MRFKVRSLEQGDFDKWVADARGRQETLSRDAYLQLAKPSEREPVRYFSSVDEQLYSAILGLCVEPGKMCAHEMMADHGHGSEQASAPARVDRAPLKGAGLPNPSAKSADPLFVDAK